MYKITKAINFKWLVFFYQPIILARQDSFAMPRAKMRERKVVYTHCIFIDP